MARLPSMPLAVAMAECLTCWKIVSNGWRTCVRSKMYELKREENRGGYFGICVDDVRKQCWRSQLYIGKADTTHNDSWNSVWRVAGCAS
jgi:hypothetical protein